MGGGGGRGEVETKKELKILKKEKKKLKEKTKIVPSQFQKVQWNLLVGEGHKLTKKKKGQFFTKALNDE